MIRRLFVLLALLAMPLALLVDGCAAIIGLDETYPLADGGESADARPDASVGDSGPADAAMMTSDGSAPDGDDGGPSVDSGPGWRFDETFGEGGVIALGLSTSPPAIDVDDGGTLRLVYSDGSENLHLCVSPFMYGGCPYLSADADGSATAKGIPIELLSNASRTVLVTNTGAPGTAAPIRVMSVAGDAPTYPLSGACLAVRGVGIDDAGTVTVAAACDGGYDLLGFAASASSTTRAATYAAGPTGLFVSTVQGEGSDLWAVGCQDCTDDGGPSAQASYLHASATGTTLASGVVTTPDHGSIATDLLALADGGLLVGSYFSGSQGVFTAVVSALDDGGGSPTASTFDLGGATLQKATSGRLAIVKVDAGMNVIVGAVTSSAELTLITVDDQGQTEPAWPQTPQFLALDFPGVENVVLGGVVFYRGALYVALEATIEQVPAIGVGKLVYVP